MDTTRPTCLYCNRSSEQIPLLKLEYLQKPYWICPQHLPILIHEPQKLTAHLPGIEILPGADHHHHD